MSPTLPILSALLLSLISGSTESGQKTDPVALLRQTLRYWRKIYKMYHEEVALGYCWADYLLEISGELSTNLFAPSSAATGDRSNATAGATKGQENPFPRNVMTDAATPLRETQRGKYLREKRSHVTSESTISKLANACNMRRVASRSEIIQKREKWMTYKAGIIPNRAKESSEIDKNNRITMVTDFYVDKRRQALTIRPELFHDERQASRGHQFLSRGTSSSAINPPPNPGDDDKVGSGSTGLEEGTRRKVLRSLTSHHDSFAQGVFGPRSFSLEIFCRRRRRSLGGRRFPFRRYSSSSRERNSRVGEPLSDLWILEEDRGMKRHPGGRRIPLNDGGNRLTLHSQFRPANADTYEHRRVVKLMDFEGKSSCVCARDPAQPINLTLGRKELFRDSFLSPRGEKTAGAEQWLLESQENGSDAVKGSALSRPGGSHTRKRRQSKKAKGSRIGRDVSATTRTIHPFFLSKAERLHREMLYENWEFSPVNSPLSIPEKRRQNDDSVRTVPSLSLVEQFTDDYKDSTSQSAQNSRPILLQTLQNRNQLSLAQSPSFVSSLRSIIIAVFRTLGMFVQVGRQIMDVVESNTALVCTKEYLWTKIIKWID
ncbi:uncharacterized protein [Linepithema humile]|uniref:uncharacterized protein n=1 Tax=Linepithema humile TaxID=83485 RepID=UPI00351DBD4C